MAYNVSASFPAWLIDTYGSDSLRQIYSATSSELPDRITRVFGRPLEALEPTGFDSAMPGWARAE